MNRAKQLESAVKDLLNVYEIPYLRVENYRCFKCGQVQNAKAKGWPDFYCYTIHLAIECKTGTARLTPEQKVIKEQLENSGNDYIELHDTTDELIEYLKDRIRT